MKSFTAVLTLCTASFFATSTTQADEFDARVARISYVSGGASYQRGDYDGWSDLRVNTPLVTGDAFYAPSWISAAASSSAWTETPKWS